MEKVNCQCTVSLIALSYLERKNSTSALYTKQNKIKGKMAVGPDQTEMGFGT